MTAHEIELQLLAEGLAPYPHDTFDFSQGAEAQRQGPDGEYSLADYLEGDSSPEAQALVNELLASLSPEQLLALEVDEEQDPEPEQEPVATAWDFLRT